MSLYHWPVGKDGLDSGLDWTGLGECRGLVFLESVLVYFCLYFSVSLQIITRGQMLTQQYLAPFLFNLR